MMGILPLDFFLFLPFPSSPYSALSKWDATSDVLQRWKTKKTPPKKKLKNFVNSFVYRLLFQPPTHQESVSPILSHASTPVQGA
ncbi:hypothetical protein LX36DRAFT_660107 [Colletotrichum falcatum]|nr:hypothetical protein LX36DRAFT_660107 [Colletotrichum falcatum]